MRSNAVRSCIHATLTMGMALGCTVAGCASSPRVPEKDGIVSRASSGLSGASCTGYHAISREGPQSRCASISAPTGRWLGRRVAGIAGEIYCSYSWIAATPAGGGGSQTPTQQKQAGAARPNSRVAASPAPAAFGAVPVLATRPTTVKTTAASKPRATVASAGGYAAAQSSTVAPPDHRVLEKLERVEIDCPVTASLAPVGPNDPAWLTTRLDTHRAQSGWVKTLPPNKTRVRVAVIDSAARPFAGGAADTYGHGRTVGRVIADLGCPLDGDSGCPVEVVNHLALPLRAPHWADYTNGGYYGTRGQLAAALNQALDAWLRDRAKGGVARLVINLSLGWSDQHGGAMQEDYRELNIASQAVYASLVRASCEGALAIAAAGNRSTLDDKGPMYPGGWETVAAPDEKLCAAYGWPADRELPVHGDDAYRPLVYAIGGVDAQDEPLSNTRPGAQPRLVGHALAVVAPDPARGGWTDTLTGTSMAAAVASGVAAAAWSFEPNATAHRMMALVYKTAVELRPPSGAETEHCLSSAAPCNGNPIRRISACETLAMAAGTNPGSLGCKTVDAHAGKAKAPGQPDVAAYAALPATGPACSAETCGKSGLVRKSDQPWVDPQPGYPSCANCFLLRSWQQIFVGFRPGATATLKSVMVQPISGTHGPVYELLAGAPSYPQYFAAIIPGSSSAVMAKMITIHSAGSVSVEMISEEPVPVF